MQSVRAAVLRTLAYDAARSYAPTALQLALSLDFGRAGAQEKTELSQAMSAIQALIAEGRIAEKFGRLALPDFVEQIQEGREKEIYFPRKLRRAVRMVGFFRWLPWVRAVCLCNTMALGQSQDSGDLDFFVVAKAGTIWRTRFFMALPLKLLGVRPGNALAKDPVCLSFFVSDEELDMSRFMLENDDPYFRHWLLSLLPLHDDGVMSQMWERNRSWIQKRHPLAKRWMATSCSYLGHTGYLPLHVKAGERNKNLSWLEAWLKKIQWRKFPKAILDLANKDTRVVVDDRALKFHVDDKREKFREKYYAICQQYGLDV